MVDVLTRGSATEILLLRSLGPAAAGPTWDDRGWTAVSVIRELVAAVVTAGETIPGRRSCVAHPGRAPALGESEPPVSTDPKSCPNRFFSGACPAAVAGSRITHRTRGRRLVMVPALRVARCSFREPLRQPIGVSILSRPSYRERPTNSATVGAGCLEDGVGLRAIEPGIGWM